MSSPGEDATDTMEMDEPRLVLIADGNAGRAQRVAAECGDDDEAGQHEHADGQCGDRDDHREAAPLSQFLTDLRTHEFDTPQLHTLGTHRYRAAQVLAKELQHRARRIDVVEFHDLAVEHEPDSPARRRVA